MVNWFGRSWGSHLNADCPACETPVGEPCARCQRPIVEGDCGVTMSSFSLTTAAVAYHLVCHLKSVLNHELWPSVGLVPDETDGLINGHWHCDHCGMRYSVREGWS